MIDRYLQHAVAGQQLARKLAIRAAANMGNNPLSKQHARWWSIRIAFR